MEQDDKQDGEPIYHDDLKPTRCGAFKKISDKDRRLIEKAKRECLEERYHRD